MSLAGGFYQPLNDLVNEMVVCDTIAVCVAAGNSNTDASTFSPASAANALTCGASTETDTRASFSNFGTIVDIYGPGTDIRGATNLDNVGTATKSGTSMTTPLVAGVVALMLEQQLLNNTELTFGDGNLAQQQVLAMGTPNRVGSPLRPLLFSSVGKPWVGVPPAPPASNPPQQPPPQPNLAPPRGQTGGPASSASNPLQRPLALVLGNWLVLLAFLFVI